MRNKEASYSEELDKRKHQTEYIKRSSPNKIFLLLLAGGIALSGYLGYMVYKFSRSYSDSIESWMESQENKKHNLIRKIEKKEDYYFDCENKGV